MPYTRAERLISAALGRAEALHQQFLAQLPAPLRAGGSYARMLPSLRAFCAERLALAATGSSWGDPLRPPEAPQSSSSSSADELEAEMARALLHLWLHFDEECAARADQVLLRCAL